MALGTYERVSFVDFADQPRPGEGSGPVFPPGADSAFARILALVYARVAGDTALAAAIESTLVQVALVALTRVPLVALTAGPPCHLARAGIRPRQWARRWSVDASRSPGDLSSAQAARKPAVAVRAPAPAGAARLRPRAARRREERARALSRLRRPAPGLRAHPLRGVRPRPAARFFLQDALLLPELPPEARPRLGRLGRAVRAAARGAPAVRLHRAETDPAVLRLPAVTEMCSASSFEGKRFLRLSPRRCSTGATAASASTTAFAS